MEQQNINRISRQFKKTFSEDGLNELGKAVRFCLRERAVTPFRLAMGLIEVFAASKVDTIADIQRAFNALCKMNVQYKPFHNQLVKNEFPVFMRSVCATLLEQLACSALHFNQASPFTCFKQIILQDGTSFSVHSALEDVFPGRFKATNPAAVELHVAMDLLTEQVENVVLTPDTDSEAQYLPAPESLVGALVIGDRGYFKKEYLFEVDREEGHFIIKGKSNMNPTVKYAITEDGREIKCWRDQKLQNIKRNLLKSKRVDMDVCWQIEGELFTCRLIISWNPETSPFKVLTR